MIDFEDISYLESGNELQQCVHRLLKDHQVFEKLAQFDPILTGTIPINIAVANSDLDIICYWQNKDDFSRALQTNFGKEKDFNLREVTFNGEETIIANFWINGFELEIFGQNIPVKQQNAYRHMVVEQQILTAKGEAFRQQVIDLKNQGYKTEPSFAKLLGLEGDPYMALLNLES